MNKKKIVVFSVKPVESADTRYRLYEYFPFLEKRGFKIIHYSFLNKKFFNWHIKNEKTFLRIIFYLFFYIKRIVQILFVTPFCDAVWILRELSPIGPPILENLIFLLKKNVILDIDDAIFIPDENVKSFTHKLRDFKKFQKISHKFTSIVVCNNFLADYFKNFNKNVFIIPTVVNTDKYSKIKRKKSKILRIGWIGSPSYYNDFEIIKNPVLKIAEEYKFFLLIIGLNKKLQWNLKRIKYLEWSLKYELKYFSIFDIGIMPLKDTEFEKGKCGFKIIQYMAAGIPVIASKVGVNSEIITDGENGFLASNEKEWYEKLKILLTDEKIRKKFSENGRKTVKNKFCVKKYEKMYWEILNNINDSE